MVPSLTPGQLVDVLLAVPDRLGPEVMVTETVPIQPLASWKLTV